MEIVVDTSAVLAVLLDEPERHAILSATRGAALSAPPSLPWELGNALSALLKRRRIEAPEAQSTLRAFALIPLQFVEIDLALALDLAARLRLYAYDAYMLQAARQRDVPLLALDERLRRAARTLGIETLEVSA